MENYEELRVNEAEEIEEVDEVEETSRHSGLGALGAMAIGSGLTLGGIALFKKLKKVVAEKRAKKGAEEAEIVDAEVIEVDPSQDVESQVSDEK